MSEPTPRELADGLRLSERSARAALERWFRGPVDRLIARRIPQHRFLALIARVFTWRGLSQKRALMSDRTLRWIEFYLRSRDPLSLESMSHEVFRAQVLIAATRMLTPSIAAVSMPKVRKASGAGSLIKPAGLYEILSYSRPLEWVGGDWSESDVESDGSVWVVVADVTYHGYIAYVIARGLAEVWRSRTIAELRRNNSSPFNILDALSDELEPVLPDDVFVEAVLARYAPEGRVIAAGAGNCRLIVRRAGNDQIDMQILGGLLLGFGSGSRDQSDFVMLAKDEVAIASDGVFEQWAGDCRQNRLEKSLATRVEGHLSSGKVLHDAILSVLNDALRTCRQHDDITLVTVRFDGDRSPARGGGHVAL
jgi:serine phosphatase RsbU (regulator of sigma subunit)